MEFKRYMITKKEISLKKLINAEKRNISYLNSLAWVLLISVVLEFVNTVLKQRFSLTSTTQITLAIYSIVLIMSMFKVLKYKGFKVKGVITYFLILMFFAINYVMFENSQTYLLDKNMLLIYLFYIPISIFVIGSIKDWNEALNIFQKFAYFAVFLSTLGITVVGYSDFLSYMEFSYSLLPFISILYYAFRQNLKLINLIAFLVGFIDILVFGARAPILFLLVFIVLYEIIRLRESKILPKITMILICILLVMVLTLFNDKIIHFVIRIAELTNSRFLIKMLNRELLISHTRSLIYEEANYALKNMGLNIYGLFGDRLLVNAIYVHNIFYELLLSFGYIFGLISILALLFLIAKAIVFNKDTTLKIMAILFTTALFLRYLVSGSFVIEGNFYIYIAIMLNICVNAREKINNEKS